MQMQNHAEGCKWEGEDTTAAARPIGSDPAALRHESRWLLADLQGNGQISWSRESMVLRRGMWHVDGAAIHDLRCPMNRVGPRVTPPRERLLE